MSLPWGSKQDIFLTLAEEYGWRGMRDVARALGISGAVANGEYGLVRGLIHDESVLAVYAKTGKWASNSNGLFTSFLKDGGTYLDIGGNIGLTTIPIANNRLVICHTFEPMPEIFDVLKSNLCKFSNCVTYNVALHRDDIDLLFEGSPINGGDNRMSTGEFDNSVRVKGMRLDAMLIDIEGPLAVKIDTQGAEPFVIEGGRKTLSQASLIAMEYSPYLINRLGGDREVVLDFLAQYPLGCALKGDSEENIEWKPMDEVLSNLDHSENGFYYDIYAAKKIPAQHQFLD